MTFHIVVVRAGDFEPAISGVNVGARARVYARYKRHSRKFYSLVAKLFFPFIIPVVKARWASNKPAPCSCEHFQTLLSRFFASTLTEVLRVSCEFWMYIKVKKTASLVTYSLEGHTHHFFTNSHPATSHNRLKNLSPKQPPSSTLRFLTPPPPPPQPLHVRICRRHTHTQTFCGYHRNRV